MNLNSSTRTPHRRWPDAIAVVAALIIAWMIIRGVRTLTSEWLGQAGGTVAGLICAAIVVFGITMALNRLMDRRG